MRAMLRTGTHLVEGEPSTAAGAGATRMSHGKLQGATKHASFKVSCGSRLGEFDAPPLAVLRVLRTIRGYHKIPI